MKIKRPAYRRGRIEMIPLIDCMFIVLVFFIYAMLSMTVHRGIEVDIPRIGAPKVDQGQPLMISVSASGQCTIDHKPVPISDLGRTLRRRASRGLSAVWINADRRARHGVVSRVYRQVGQAGIERMVILTEPTEASH